MDEPIVYTEDPFSYNYLALKESHVNELPLPTPQQMVADPYYNAIGKFLGVDNVHGWNKNYDKIHKIAEWARERSGQQETAAIVGWIGEILNRVPNLGAKKITNLYNHIRLMGEQREHQS